MKFLAKNFYFIIASILVIGSSFFVGYNFGSKHGIPAIEKVITLSGKEEAKPATVDFSPFWKVWALLNEKYVATKDIPTDQEKVWGAIQGLASSLGDPYTTFMPPVEKKAFEEQISGNFEGVGMEIDVKDQILTVIAPLKGNPAIKAGVRAGDQILKINDTITAGMTLEKAVSLIRGKKGTEVRLTLARSSTPTPFEIKIVRDTITIPTVDTEFRENGVFVISLHNFSAVSPDLFREALRDFVISRSTKLVLDLRGNPGGYLEAAVDMASWFLPAGEVIVREEAGRNGAGDVFRSRGYNIFNNKLKMVILVNGGSASASEILAGALQEHHKATLVGEKTFGKGSVQELFPVTGDTSLKITIARWLTPNGVSISEGGLKPDVEVKITEEDIKKQKDPQMDKAIELLLKN